MSGLRTAAGVIGALALIVSAAAAAAAERSAPLSELTGLSPTAVRARLVEGSGAWPAPAAFEIATPEGRLTLITLGDLLLDPQARALNAVFRTHGDPPRGMTPGLDCSYRLARATGASELAGLVTLVFRDDHLQSAYQFVDERPPPPPDYRDTKAQEAYVRRPVSSPFIARLGELPLEDGARFLDRIAKAPLTAADVLSASCVPYRPPALPARSGSHALDASDWQGLALLPWAVILPAKNSQRAQAAREGSALLASLRVGEPLGAAPAAFAAAHRGVRAYPAREGDYAVLSVDLGGWPGRNLTNFNDAALVGVRGGTVEWISPPAGAGPRPDLLCLDEHGVGSTPRKGCGGWGHFNP